MPESFEFMDPELLYEAVSQGLIPMNRCGPGEFTILLVGEPGIATTGVVSLMSNIIQGTWFIPLVDINGPVGRSGDFKDENHHRTNGVALYSYKSQNSLKFNILDASGLVDVHGPNNEKLVKEAVTKTIKDKVIVINAVFVLVDGTLPHLTIPIVDALPTLSSMFSNSLSNNICFVFNNVSDQQAMTFDGDSIPEALRDCPRFYFDNPIPKLIEPREAGAKINLARRNEWRDREVDNGKEVIQALIEIFKWTDKLSPQPLKDVLSLYEQSRGFEKKIFDTLAAATQIAQQESSRLEDTDYDTTLCMVPGCYKNCHEHCNLHFSLNPEKHRACWAFGEGYPSAIQKCRTCGHGHTEHRQFNARWESRKNDAVVASDDEKQRLRDSLVSDVGRLIGDYAKLPLLGHFADHLKQLIRLLEINIGAVREKAADNDIVQPLGKALDELKQRLVVVEQAVDKESIGHKKKAHVSQGIE